MDESINNFKTWFKSNGGILHLSIEPTCFPHGKSLQVTRDVPPIEPGSTIVKCPHAITISYANARISRELKPLIETDAGSGSTNQIIVLRLFLVQQYLLERDSFWWPYIRSLPSPGYTSGLTTPMWYTDEDLKWIEGTNLAKAASSRKMAWRQEYEEAMGVLNQTNELPNPSTWTWFVLRSNINPLLN